MTQYENAAAEETEDRFYAQFDSREVKLMTLDELVSAFEAGEIHENTFVCREGESEWETLADVAGLNGSEEEAQAAPEPVIERRPPMSNRPPEGALATETRPPMPNRIPEGAVASRPPMPNRVPEAIGETRPPMPSRRPGAETLPPSRQVSAYPSVAVPPAPLSFAPVTSNIELSHLDLDDLALRPKRKTGKIVGIVAGLGALAAAGAFVANGGLHAFATPSMSELASAGQKSQASLSLSNLDSKPSTPAQVTPPPVAAPTPAAAPSSTGDSSAQTSNAGFSDDMKSALLAADKERANKHAAKAKAHAATASVARHSGKSSSSSAGFKSGGSAYDPLNGKL